MTDPLKESETLAKDASVAARLAAISLLRGLPDSDRRRNVLTTLSVDTDEEISNRAKSLLQQHRGAERTNSVEKLEVVVGDIPVSELSAGLLRILVTGEKSPNREFPFPQANSLDTLCRLVAGTQNPELFQTDTIFKGLSPRQVNYYETAAGFLALDQLKFTEPETLKEEDAISGRDFFSFVVHLTERHSILRRKLQSWILGTPLDDEFSTPHALSVWLDQLGYLPLSPETLERRAQTIDAWFEWITQKLELLRPSNDLGSSWPTAVNLTRSLIRLEELDRAGTLTSTSRQGQGTSKSSRKRLLARRDDFGYLLPRLSRFLPSDGPSLDDIGNGLGVTRERIRQIESQISRETSSFLEAEGSEVIDALRSASETRPPVDLCGWTLRCLKLAYAEEATTAESIRNASNLVRFENDWEDVRTLDSEFGGEIASMVPGCENDGLRKTVFLLRLALIHEDYFSPSEARGLWVHRTSPVSTYPSDQTTSSASRKREKKLEQLRRELENGPKSAKDIAANLKEESTKALAEFMRRNDEFTLWRGNWYLSTDPLLKETGPRFRSAYDALLYVLEISGPISTRELKEKLDEIHPMSWSRMQQTLDHQRVGRLPGGQVALITQGGEKPAEPEPEIPEGMSFSFPLVSLLFQINQDHLRGSGFSLPRWIGWKLGLRSSPESVIFTNKAFGKLSVTRRGGQIWAGSISSVLKSSGMNKHCLAELILDIEKISFELHHLCEEHVTGLKESPS